MAAHAAAFGEKIAAEVERVGALRNTITRVTLLAPGLDVLFFKHRPKPETMTPVALDVAGGGAAVAPVTTRAAKLLRIVNAQHFAIGMADKRARQIVRRFSWSIGSEIGRSHVDGLANAGMTDLATIDDVVGANA